MREATHSNRQTTHTRQAMFRAGVLTDVFELSLADEWYTYRYYKP